LRPGKAKPVQVGDIEEKEEDIQSQVGDTVGGS